MWTWYSTKIVSIKMKINRAPKIRLCDQINLIELINNYNVNVITFTGTFKLQNIEYYNTITFPKINKIFLYVKTYNYQKSICVCINSYMIKICGHGYRTFANLLNK